MRQLEFEERARIAAQTRLLVDVTQLAKLRRLTAPYRHEKPAKTLAEQQPPFQSSSRRQYPEFLPDDPEIPLPRPCRYFYCSPAALAYLREVPNHAAYANTQALAARRD